MKKILFSVLMAVSFSVSAEKPPCNGLVDNDWRSCVIELHKKELLMSYLDVVQRLFKTNNDEAVSALNKSQLAWAQYRDDTCNYIGVVSDVDYYAVCLANMDDSRVKVLKSYLKALK